MSDNEERTDEGGTSMTKKVAAGAAIGVAVPAAVAVARKLTAGDDSEGQSSSGSGQSRRRASAGRQGSTRGTQRRTTGSTRTGSTAKTTARKKERTKEQLYREAKRLNVEGRSRMTKTQLERAVARARS
jgi:hypothetical protein